MSEPDPKLLAEMRGWKAGPCTEQDIAEESGELACIVKNAATRDLVLLMARSWEAMRDVAEDLEQWDEVGIVLPTRVSSVTSLTSTPFGRTEMARKVAAALALARGEEE